MNINSKFLCEKTAIERSKNLLINNNINNKNNLKYCKECIREDKEIVVGLDEEIIKNQIALINNSRYLLNDFYVHKNKEFFRDYYIRKVKRDINKINLKREKWLTFIK